MALAAYAGDDRLALDFHHEVYRQAEAVADGRDAYESPDADLSDRSNAVWPMAAVLPVVPLTALPPAVADWLATAVMLASLVGALWLLNVRDWRIYGVVLLWPAVIEAIQTANASLPLTLLVAVMWRYRDRAGIAGAALGYAVAVKLFLWPVVVWLALIGRRSAAAVAAAVAAASLLLVLPFTGLVDYARLLRNIGETFEHEAYTPFALLTDLGVPDTAARGVTIAFGLGVLALAWRRRSLGLALAAALVLSPIVWRHFFTLLLVPLAAVASTFRRRVARSRRDVGRRRHVQRRALADGMCPRSRRRDDRPLRAGAAARRRRRALRRARLPADLGRDEPRRPSNPRDRAPRRASDRRRRRDVRGRELDRLALRGLPQRALPRGEAAARLGRTRSPARITRSSRAEPHLAAGRRVPRRAAAPSSPPARPTGRSRSSGSRCFMLSLRIVGVRDWRVYGAFALWPSVIGEIRVSHLTPFLCLLLALAWRYRDVRFAPGLAVGLAGAIKFFLWPLGVWLAAIGRGARDARSRRPSRAPRSLLVLPFTGLDDYVRTLLELGRTFDQDSYSPFGLPRADRRRRTARARRDARDRGRAPRRLLAPGEPRARRRGCARALADRVARLLRGRGDPARRRPAAALGSSGSSRLRRGAC